MLKKVIIALLMCIPVLSGCGTEKATDDTDNLAKIEVYLAGNNELLGEIDDRELLIRFNVGVELDDSDSEEHQSQLKKAVVESGEQYYLTAYKYPVSKLGSQELEELYTIALYDNSNIIKMTVAQESVKSAYIPEEFLTFYYEISDEDIDFYRSLADTAS